MRGNVPSYELKTTKTLRETLELMRKEPGIWKPISGGTDLMVLLEMGTLQHKQWINLLPFSELSGIQASSDRVSIGALTTFSQIHQNATIRTEFPALAQAARSLGAIAIQNRATVGGNIANASPAADSPPALLAYDAQIEIISASGTRTVPYSEFHTGYKKTKLAADELIKAVHLPRKFKEWKHHFRKVGTRKAQAISKIAFAGTALVREKHIDDIRLTFGSVAPTVVRCIQTENMIKNQTLSESLIAQAKVALTREIAPINDIRSTAEYRMRVAANLLEEFLIKVLHD